MPLPPCQPCRLKLYTYVRHSVGKSTHLSLSLSPPGTPTHTHTHTLSQTQTHTRRARKRHRGRQSGSQARVRTQRIHHFPPATSHSPKTGRGGIWRDTSRPSPARPSVRLSTCPRPSLLTSPSPTLATQALICVSVCRCLPQPI